jgi:Histidine kinase-, DNA gyrase B-, and HSP90-like ATPase
MPGRGSSLLNRQPPAEEFTKFAMLSRLRWTTDQKDLLRTMWDRGDAVALIATALGIKCPAASVARQRFGLTPRRKVSRRSARRAEPDERTHKIERVAFTTSRLMEFCRKKELETQTGHPVGMWPQVVFKELVDNALDACEEAEVAPVIRVRVSTSAAGSTIVIDDNGPGVPAATFDGISDYTVRSSSREAYVSPTRGAQGNALKTILAMAFVKSGEEGETTIEACGISHRIRFEIDQIRQEPSVTVSRARSTVRNGTRVTVF